MGSAPGLTVIFLLALSIAVITVPAAMPAPITDCPIANPS